jgi:hypothetical protein
MHEILRRLIHDAVGTACSMHAININIIFNCVIMLIFAVEHGIHLLGACLRSPGYSPAACRG